MLITFFHLFISYPRWKYKAIKYKCTTSSYPLLSMFLKWWIVIVQYENVSCLTFWFPFDKTVWHAVGSWLWAFSSPARLMIRLIVQCFQKTGNSRVRELLWMARDGTRPPTPVASDELRGQWPWPARWTHSQPPSPGGSLVNATHQTSCAFETMHRGKKHPAQR